MRIYKDPNLLVLVFNVFRVGNSQQIDNLKLTI